MNLYEHDFQFFLKHTNEKRILFEEIRKIIPSFGVTSILDIGAGDGQLSIPLSKLVKRFVCIEPKKEFVDLLRKGNLEVIEDFFPCDVKGEFDLILCSHSLPYLKKEFEPFILEGLKKLTNKGIFLVITYVGKKDDWALFLDEVGIPPFVNAFHRYGVRKSFMKKIGELEEFFVYSRVETKRIEDMVRALSFVASGGLKERKDDFMMKESKIKEILKLKYFDNKRKKYSFPFRHAFLILRK